MYLFYKMKLYICILLLVNYAYASGFACRKVEPWVLRSDLTFKYSYKETEASLTDVDFSQRGDRIDCNTNAIADGITGPLCESVSRSEGPGMDRFGWAKQLMVGVKGSVKFYTGNLNGAMNEFTSGTECGSKVRMALGSSFAAAVCKHAVRVYRYDGTSWSDHGELDYSSGLAHEMDIALNHEDYLIVSVPSTSTVQIIKLGMEMEVVQTTTGNGAVATAVNCQGSVFAFVKDDTIKLKQLSQKTLEWTNLEDVPMTADAIAMSSDVLVGSTGSETKVFFFTNDAYTEYKVIFKSGKVALEHDHLIIYNNGGAYKFDEGPSTKCLALHKLVNGVCVYCGLGYGNLDDNTETTCIDVQCTANQYVLNHECQDCLTGTSAGGSTGGNDTECVCPAGSTFNKNTGACDPILCGEDFRVSSNECVPCDNGEANQAGDDASGADTFCFPFFCNPDEYVSNYVCIPCPDGGRRAETDNRSGNDTVCEPLTTCNANEYYDVTSGQCQSCPAGTQSEVIDDSIQKLGNASCVAILCGENERVQNNACVACPSGSERAAGDDATGANTECTCSEGYSGDGTSCTACGSNEESFTHSDGSKTCICSEGSESDGSTCNACPSNANALAGPKSSMCVVNPDAQADGACPVDCKSKVADNNNCILPFEDSMSTPCCKIMKAQQCGCNENFHVLNNACTACTVGELRAAGDDPDNGNTYCNTEGITLAFGNNGNDDFVYNAQNDPLIVIDVGKTYTFLRDTGGHPLRIVSAADCPSCATGTYDSLPNAYEGLVDAVSGVANTVWKPTVEGTYYYVCTAHPSMVGELNVVWPSCTMSSQGSVTLSESCKIESSVTLTGALSVNTALQSTGEKLLLSMADITAINAGTYAFILNNVELTGISSANPFATGDSITLNNVDVKGNTQTGSLFVSSGHLVAQNIYIEGPSSQIVIDGTGDVSIANVVSSGVTLVKHSAGAVVARDINITDGRLGELSDSTTVFEAVIADNSDLVAVNSAVQVERSSFKTKGISFDSSTCTECKRELILSGIDFDGSQVNVVSNALNKPVVKVIEGSGANLVSDNGISLYAIDANLTATDAIIEECLPHQCSHKPLATSCRVKPGKGTECICDVGVATYNLETQELDKQSSVEEMLSLAFATADEMDRVIKLVDKNVRYIPTQATPQAAKSNILLLKPSNNDGEMESEKTILVKPDSGVVCATFQTWLCNELSACHYSNGTLTAVCDGTPIQLPQRRLRSFMKKKLLRADENCDYNQVVNLKVPCVQGSMIYSRCVENAFFFHNQCVCAEGLKANSNGDACIDENNLCEQNERVKDGKCIPCEGMLTNKAGDDKTGADTTCDDVICREGFYSTGNGGCLRCAAGAFNLAGDIAYDANSGNGPATTCCSSGEYEFDVDLNAGTRTCKACGDATEGIRVRFGTTGGGLKCCRGERLTADAELKCNRLMEYYKKVCQPLEDTYTCPVQTYI